VTAKKYMFPSKYEDAGAQKILNEWKPERHAPLVQIDDAATQGSEKLQEVAGD